MLSEKQKSVFLQRTSLFAHVPPEALLSICKIAQEQEYPAGHVLMHEGEKGDTMYLMVDGEVEILKDNTHLMMVGGSGDCFGEMALIDDEPRSATIRTAKPTRLLEITREDFYPAMAREFSIARGVFRELNTRIRRDLNDRLTNIRDEVAREESMRMAAEVQQSLLPSEEINHPKLTTAGYCQPAGSVGGDYYDYIPLSDGRFAIFLGEVMGHGFHSAMLTAMTKSGLHTQLQFDASIPAVMNAIHRIASYHIRTWIYLTCCYVIIDLPNRSLEFANAGHPSMLLCRGATGEITELASQFIPLGLLPTEEETTYEGETAEWRPGDLLVFYSDGITEAGNPEEELYGEERLKAIISASLSSSPDEIKQAVLADLEAYRCGTPADDDVTLVIAKFL